VSFCQLQILTHFFSNYFCFLFVALLIKKHKKMNQEIYILTHEKKVLFEGTKDKCFFKLLDIQPMSCYWAIKYEAYKITLK